MKNKYITVWQTPLVRMILITAIIGTFGASLYNIVLVQYAAKLPHASVAVLIVSIADTIPYLIQSIPGKIADHTKNKLKAAFFSSITQSLFFLIISLLVTKQNWYLLIIVIVINVTSDTLELYNSGLVTVLQQKYVIPDLMETTTGMIRSSALLINIGGQSLGVLILTMTNYNFSILAIVNSITFALVAIIISQNIKRDSEENTVALNNSSNQNQTKDNIHTIKDSFWTLISEIFQASPKLFVMTAFIANFLGASLIPLINVGLLHQTNRMFSYPVSLLIVSLSITAGNFIGSLLSDMLFKNEDVISISLISNSFLMMFFFSFFIIKLEILSYLLLFTFSLISAVSNIKISATIMKKVKSNQLASFYTSYSSLMYLAMPVGMTVIPAVALLGNELSAIILIGLTAIMMLMLSLSRRIYHNISR